jgi:hypothetical protein
VGWHGMQWVGMACSGLVSSDVVCLVPVGSPLSEAAREGFQSSEHCTLVGSVCLQV